MNLYITQDAAGVQELWPERPKRSWSFWHLDNVVPFAVPDHCRIDFGDSNVPHIATVDIHIIEELSI